MHRPTRLVRLGFVLAGAAAFVEASLVAQDRLKTMPGYEQYQRMSRDIQGAVKSGAVTGRWTSATTFEYTRDGTAYAFDVTTGKAAPVGGVSSSSQIVPAGRGGGAGVE